MPHHLRYISFCRRRRGLSHEGLTGDIDVGHDHYDGVLLHIERAVVQSEGFPKEAKLAFGHGMIPSDPEGICDQLDRQGNDGDGRLAQSE